MSTANNLKGAPTTSDQLIEDGYELTKERIETAFSNAGQSTKPASNNAGNEIFVPQLNREGISRGVRWNFSPPRTTLVGFVTEQRWQGHILSVDANGRFWARVYDQSQPQGDEVEEAQFDSEDVPDLMRSLVKPGGIFFWDIGFKIEPSGQRVRQSVLSFPMIPIITSRDKIAAKERAKQRFEQLGWDRRENGHPEQSKDTARSG